MRVMAFVNECSNTKSLFRFQQYTSIITNQIVKMDLLKPIGASVIALGCLTLILTYIAVGIACCAGHLVVEEGELNDGEGKGTELQKSDRKSLVENAISDLERKSQNAISDLERKIFKKKDIARENKI